MGPEEQRWSLGVLLMCSVLENLGDPACQVKGKCQSPRDRHGIITWSKRMGEAFQSRRISAPSQMSESWIRELGRELDQRSRCKCALKTTFLLSS